MGRSFLFWTHLRLLICGRGNVAWKPPISISYPCWSAANGFTFQIKLPHIIDNTLATVGGMIGPVGMLVAGMLLLPAATADSTWAEVLSCCFLRLILIPILLLLPSKFAVLPIMMRMRIRVVLISFWQRLRLPPRQLPKWQLFTERMPKSQRDLWADDLCFVW